MFPSEIIRMNKLSEIRGHARAIAAAAGVFIVTFLLSSRSYGLATVESLKDYKPGRGTTVLAENGGILGHIRIEKNVPVPLDQIPQFLLDAVLATEDPRFYRHTGIDYRGILRAALTDIVSVQLKEGGSTITQQLAKVLFLSPERNFTRKLKEVAIARRLEKELTKQEILELYLNNIYFGHGAYGVEMAARTYFGKHVRELNQAEAALLSGLPQSPMGYSPYNDIDLAKQRQWHVLKRMIAEEYLNEAQAIQIYNEPLKLENLRAQEEIAPHVVDSVRKYIEKKYGTEALYRGGFTVYTSIDPGLQRAAVTALQDGLRALDKRHGFRGRIGFKQPAATQARLAALPVIVKAGEGFNAQVLAVGDTTLTVKGRGLVGSIAFEDMAWALARPKKDKEGRAAYRKPGDLVQVGDIIKVRLLTHDDKNRITNFSLDQTPLVEGAVVSIEPYTGYIRALAGGYDFVEGGFNHAMDARRQPGSAFKPFIYGAALESGFTPASILMDLPRMYGNDGPGNKAWTPVNYDHRFLGPMRLRTALELSRNAVTVGLIETIGLNKAIEFARKAGIESPISRDFTTALGSSVVSPLELTAAYATFASQGVRTKPILIKTIVDGNGKVLENYEPQPEQAIDAATAFLVTSLLKSAAETGTGKAARALARPVAGKTGTTNKFIDAWFIGYAPALITGVWVGYDNPKISLGERETGARAALPIWMSVMANALADKPLDDFTPAGDIVTVNIDPGTGLLARDSQMDAIAELFRRGTEPTRTAELMNPGRPAFPDQRAAYAPIGKALPDDEIDD